MSLAPTCNGMMKFPKPLTNANEITKKIMIVPCIVMRLR